MNRMLLTIAFRHLVVKKWRSAFLLVGFGIGTGVMMVLLSIGEAMVVQSQDVSLVGGGEVTILPEGVDLEALRTGALTGFFLGIDRARFVHRQTVEGSRQHGWVEAGSPAIERKLVYLVARGDTVAVRAAGEIPSRAARVGTGIEVLSGNWSDTEADRRFVAPTAQQLYDEIDRFHRPGLRDSTWGEWHYFNIVTGPDEWWYITYLIGGDLEGDAWGGGLLITRNRPDGGHDRFEAQVPREQIRFDTTAAALTLGAATVRQRDGRYRIVGSATGAAGAVSFDFEIAPERQAYFPPVELRSDRFRSGYVVPILRGAATGTLCDGRQCRTVTAAPAYHDHNWGVWRDVTWEWGQARGRAVSIVYGGVRAPDSTATAAPYFLAVVDSNGVRTVLRFSAVDYQGARPVPGAPGVMAPERLVIVASRDRDTVRLTATIRQAQASRARSATFGRYFLQLHGGFVVDGTVGDRIQDGGSGFFETYVSVESRRSSESPGAGRYGVADARPGTTATATH